MLGIGLPELIVLLVFISTPVAFYFIVKAIVKAIKKKKRHGVNEHF